MKALFSRVIHMERLQLLCCLTWKLLVVRVLPKNQTSIPSVFSRSKSPSVRSAVNTPNVNMFDSTFLTLTFCLNRLIINYHFCCFQNFMLGGLECFSYFVLILSSSAEAVQLAHLNYELNIITIF